MVKRYKNKPKISFKLFSILRSLIGVKSAYKGFKHKRQFKIIY